MTLKFFSGSSHLSLAQEVCSLLKSPLGQREIKRFPDGETHVKILEDVRGLDVFVLQTLAHDPNSYLMELLIMVDALKRAGAKSMTAIIPYLGYCRQDRKDQPGVAIAAKLIANLLSASGISRLITFDLHADQIEGFFEMPVDHVRCQTVLCQKAKKLMGEKLILVAPDMGSVKIVEKMAQELNAGLAVITKERLSACKVRMGLIGCVDQCEVLIIDDLCSTAGTLAEAARLCKQMGAKKIVAAVTHGLFVGDAIQKIVASPIEHLIVSNTIEQKSFPHFMTSVSIASLIAERM